MVNNLGFVTVNGKECYEISVFDHGLLYGDGVFDSFRIFNGKAFLFEDHINRLYASAKGISLKIPYARQELIQLVKSAYRKSNLNSAFIRIIVTRGVAEQGLSSASKPNVIIIVNERKFKPMGKINLAISNVRRVSKNAINPKIKSLNYMNNILARLDAMKRRFDDAVLLNEEGFVTEVTTSNLFIVKNEKIYTPSPDSGIFEGLTRKAIMDNFHVIEKSMTKRDLFSADEIFLSGDVNFISCVARLENKKFNSHEYAKGVYQKLISLTQKGTLLK